MRTPELNASPPPAREVETFLSKVYPGLVLLLVATSSFVLIEPAPYDVIAMGLIVMFYALGLKVPGGLGVPLTLWSALLLANLLSMVAADPGHGISIGKMSSYLGTTAYLMATWLMFASLVNLDAERTLGAVWTGYLIAAVIGVVTAIIGYFSLIPSLYESFTLYGRGSGTFKDPNVLGPFLVPVALYLVHRLLDQFNVAQLGRLALLAAMLFGMLITFSRGAWGNFTLALIVYLLLRTVTARSTGQLAKLFMVAVPSTLAIGGTVVGLALLNPDVGALMEQRTNLMQAYDAGRFGTQLEALHEGLSEPLGVGPNNTHKVLGMQPHNIYVKLFSDNGWLGGMAFVLLAVMTLWRGLSASLMRSPMQGQTIVLYAAVVATLAESFIIDTLHWRHMFLLLGLLWGLIAWQQAHAEKPVGRRQSRDPSQSRAGRLGAAPSA